MGVDTIVKIPGKIESNKIFDFIKKNFDENATNDVKIKVQSQELVDSLTESNSIILGAELIFESGFIHFRYKEEQRSLFFSMEIIICLPLMRLKRIWIAILGSLMEIILI